MDPKELRLEFCRILAGQGLDAQTAIRDAEVMVNYIRSGPDKPEETPETKPLKAVS